MAQGLDLVRQAVLIDMAFELGGEGLRGFEKMLEAIRTAQWAKAAAELRNSLLAHQVPGRAEINAKMLETGLWPRGVASAEWHIKLNEGCQLEPRPDAKGMWVVGWGHDIPEPSAGPALASCSRVQADEWFEQDFALAKARACVALGEKCWGKEAVSV